MAEGSRIMPGRTVLSSREGAVTYLVHPRETKDGNSDKTNKMNVDLNKTNNKMYMEMNKLMLLVRWPRIAGIVARRHGRFQRVPLPKGGRVYRFQIFRTETLFAK
jgi:hypothetical protein